MADAWEPAAQVAKNAQGQYVALVGDQWQPVASAAKSADGKYMVMRNPGATPAAPSAPAAAPAAPPEPSFGDRMKDAGKGYLDSISAIPQAATNMATGMLAKPVSEVAGLAAAGKDILTGNKNGDPQGFKNEIQSKLTYQPRGKFSKAVTEYNPLALAGKVIGSGADKAADVVGGDDPGPLRSAAANYTREAIPAALGVIGPKAAKAAPAAIADTAAASRNALARGIKITPEMSELNAKAQAHGIQLRPDQLTDNKFMKILGETFDHVPGSGSKTDANYGAMQKALIKQIGGDPKATNLTPKVFDQALRRSGGTIEAIARKYELVPDQTLAHDLAGILNDAHKYETAENARIIQNHVDSIIEPLSQGPMPGTAFRKWNTQLRQRIQGTSNPDLKNALVDLQESVLETFKDGISNPRDLKIYNDARAQYAKANRIAPIVDIGGVAPTKLPSVMYNTKAGKMDRARSRAGDLGGLADIGQRMKEPRSSLTGERNLVYGALGLGAAGSPGIGVPALAGTYGAANLYNRLGHHLIPPKP